MWFFKKALYKPNLTKFLTEKILTRSFSTDFFHDKCFKKSNLENHKSLNNAKKTKTLLGHREKQEKHLRNCLFPQLGPSLTLACFCWKGSLRN